MSIDPTSWVGVLQAEPWLQQWWEQLPAVWRIVPSQMKIHHNNLRISMPGATATLRWPLGSFSQLVVIFHLNASMSPIYWVWEVPHQSGRSMDADFFLIMEAIRTGSPYYWGQP